MSKISSSDIRKYLNTKGVRCINPKCKSYDIAGGFVSTNEGSAQQDMNCNKCQTTWTDHYFLHSVTNIEI